MMIVVSGVQVFENEEFSYFNLVSIIMHIMYLNLLSFCLVIYISGCVVDL